MSSDEFYQIFMDILKLFKDIEEEGTFTDSFSEATTIQIPKPDKGTTKKEIIGQYP